VNVNAASQPDEIVVLMSEAFTPAELQEFHRRLLEHKAKKVLAQRQSLARRAGLTLEPAEVRTEGEME
jgi:hypothetical protein